MSNASLLSFLITSEILLIFTVYAVYKLIKKPKYMPVDGDDVKHNELSSDDTVQYIQTEINRVTSELNKRNSTAITDYDNIDYLALNMRLLFLGVENNNISNFDKKQDLADMEAMISSLFEKYKIITALKLLHENGEYVEDKYREIIDKQNKTIDFLKKYANEILAKILKKNEELINNADNEEYALQLTEINNEFKQQTSKLVDEIQYLETNNNDMNKCIGVLEDENKFLRNQIEQLLKFDSDL